MKSIFEVPLAINENYLQQMASSPFLQSNQVFKKIVDWGYDVTGDVATIYIKGPLSRKASTEVWQEEGTAIEIVEQHFDTLIDDDDINTIVLSIDSPGGYVDSVDTFAEKVFEARGKKRIVALVDTLATSAAYWLAAATEKIYLASQLAKIGSIGVLLIHRDYSEKEKKEGIKTTEIFAGEYKTLGSSVKPLSGDDLAKLQAQVDFMYNIFVDTIARYRNSSIEQILKVAKGQVLIGTQAVKSILADDFLKGDIVQKKEELTVAYLKEKETALFDEIYSKGVVAERKRVKELLALTEGNLKQFQDVVLKAVIEGNSLAETQAKLLQTIATTSISSSTSGPNSINNLKRLKEELIHESESVEVQKERDGDEGKKVMIQAIAAGMQKAR